MATALYNIKLSATESNWRLFMVRKADPKFGAFAQKIFTRDQHTCQFCGFKSKQFQESVNLDGNYRNNRLSNLATACVFCAQCFFLEAIGKGDFSGGTLIVLPEMTQGELNALCHVLFNAIVTGNSDNTQAKNIYRGLRLRSQTVEKELGEGMSSPALYGHMLIDAQVDNKHEFCQSLEPNLRVLPALSQFTTQVETWALEGLQALQF